MCKYRHGVLAADNKNDNITNLLKYKFMKKIFTLAAAVLCATAINAQTEKYSVVDETNALRAEFTANADPSQASVVDIDATPNVHLYAVSGPIKGMKDGSTLPLETEYDNTWGLSNKKLSSDETTVPTFYYVTGKGNPYISVSTEEVVTDGVPTGNYRALYTFYEPDGSLGLPTNGTYFKLTPKVDGQFKVPVWINKGNRKMFIVEEGTKKALDVTSNRDGVHAEGYVNGQNNDVADDSPLKGYPMYQELIMNQYDYKLSMDPTDESGSPYVIGYGNQAIWAYMFFPAKANETYWVFCHSAQIGFGGYEFTPSGSNGISEITSNTVNADAPIYNLAGQRVGKDAKGILIQNGKKFIR